MTNFIILVMYGIARNFTHAFKAVEMDTEKCDTTKLASCQVLYYFTDKREEL